VVVFKRRCCFSATYRAAEWTPGISKWGFLRTTNWVSVVPWTIQRGVYRRFEFIEANIELHSQPRIQFDDREQRLRGAVYKRVKPPITER
jgi:hypothetical protein